MTLRWRQFLIVTAMIGLPLGLAISQEGGSPPPAPPELKTGPGLDSAHAEIAAGFEELRPIFKRSCFDCHSDQTVYPWYHSLPFIGSWMDEHVTEARAELDFSNGFPFPGENPRQAGRIARIKREIESEKMPLDSYLWVHWDADLSQEEKDAIFAWVDKSVERLAPYGDILRRRNPQGGPGGPPPGGGGQ